MYKITKYFKKLKDDLIQCNLCPNSCIISNNKTGICKVRKNIDGELYLISYGIVSSVAIDPIEKKPLYHFYPGSRILSIGSYGCNFKCRGCQNFSISTEFSEELFLEKLSPKQIIDLCKKNNLYMIAFTYNEPTVAFEYVLDTFKLAQLNSIKTVLVTNGYINLDPLKELAKYTNAVNIDLKGFSEKFYFDYSNARLKPVLDSIVHYKKLNVHVELTTLIIPQLNDNFDEIEKMCKWILKNLGKETPLHFSRFYPMYKAKGNLTDLKLLNKCHDIAKKYLDYVYVGNVSNNIYQNTYCSKCNTLLIERNNYIIRNKIKHNKCINCNNKIFGFFE